MSVPHSEIMKENVFFSPPTPIGGRRIFCRENFIVKIRHKANSRLRHWQADSLKISHSTYL